MFWVHCGDHWMRHYEPGEMKTNCPGILQKGIITVGLPDVTAMNKDDPMQKIFKQKIKADAAVVCHVIIGAKEMWLNKELFDDKWWELL